MSCCGKKRNEFAGSHTYNTASTTSVLLQKMWDDVLFEYIGNTALTAKGSITGRTYRFNFKNDQQFVDYRDASGMMAVPVLRKVKQNKEA